MIAITGLQQVKILILKQKNHGLYDIKYTDSAGNETVIQKLINYDYVTDGLIAYYDAENNIGTGHSDTTTIWKDLSGNNNDVILNPAHKFKSNVLECSKKESAYSISKNAIFVEEPKDYTIEVVAKFNTTESGWICSARNSGDAEGIQIFQHTDSEYRQAYGLFQHSNGEYKQVKFKPRIQEIFNRSITYKTDAQELNVFENASIVEKVTAEYASIGGKKLQVGGTTWNKDISLNGNIYNIRIYERTLTEQEMLHNYNIDKNRYNITE